MNKIEAYQSVYDRYMIQSSPHNIESWDKQCLCYVIQVCLPITHKEPLQKLGLTEDQAVKLYTEAKRKSAGSI